MTIPTSTDSVAHVVQVALTPAFLLAGIATLLNAFSTRLGRVADRVDQLAFKTETAEDARQPQLRAELAFLRQRSFALDIAVVLAALAGMATCGAALTLFVGALRERTAEGVLFAMFGAAVILTIGALGAFGVEMLMASRGLRAAATRASRPERP